MTIRPMFTLLHTTIRSCRGTHVCQIPVRSIFLLSLFSMNLCNALRPLLQLYHLGAGERSLCTHCTSIRVEQLSTAFAANGTWNSTERLVPSPIKIERLMLALKDGHLPKYVHYSMCHISRYRTAEKKAGFLYDLLHCSFNVRSVLSVYNEPEHSP